MGDEAGDEEPDQEAGSDQGSEDSDTGESTSSDDGSSSEDSSSSDDGSSSEDDTSAVTESGDTEDGMGRDCPGDLDCDGLLDEDDPLPTDPFPPFIVNGTETGVLEVRTSNGDGTFTPPVEFGLPHGGHTPSPDDYPVYYAAPSIADYDGDGKLDMLVGAYRSPDLPRELWWFERVGPAQFEQRLVDADSPPLANRPIDLDGDHTPDQFTYEIDQPNYIAAVRVFGLHLKGDVRTSNCAVSDDPLNPDGCVFVRSPMTSLSPWYSGQWGLNLSTYGRDLDGDGRDDLLITKYASGGASPSPLARLDGLGDGTFTDSPTDLYTHPLPVNTMVIEDFDEDGVYDLIAGCDDDGDPGSLWFYPGTLTQGEYSLDANSAFETIDFGNSGHSCRVAAFDWDGDGHLDLVTGHNTGGVFATPTQLNYFHGLGDGNFEGPVELATYPGVEGWRLVGPVLF